MILFKILYLFLAIALLGILVFVFSKTHKSKHVLRNYILLLLGIEIFALIIHSAFIFIDNYYVAVVLQSVYFIALTLLTYRMLLFSYAYTGHIRKLPCIWFFRVITILDSISMIVNNFTHHSFDVELYYFKDYFQYWGCTFTYVHTIHLSVCYLMFFVAIIIMLVASLNSSSFYKRKFNYILVTYIFIVVLNIVCYIMKFPIDFSVLFYGVLSGFICYYTLYSFQHHLVSFLLDNVNEKIDDGLIFFDEKGKYAYSNRVARLLLKDTSGKFSPKLAEEYANAWKSVHPESEKNGRDSFVLDGTEHYFTVEYQTLISEGSIIGSFFKFVDRTKETNVYLKERYNATHDELTGLYNRVGFFDAVEEIQVQIQKKTHITYLMLFSNIKDFKLVNEIFGNNIGDAILKKQAKIMQTYSHLDTISGRISDDKFAMYLRKDYFDEKLFLDSIKELTDTIPNSNYKLKIHIGIYESRLMFESPQIMCDKAQMACEQIESDYQNTFSRYNANLMDKMLEEKKILNEFDSALADGQFKLYLQPQIAYSGSNNERYFGTEALVRWHHPTRGILYPESFISVLEKNGLIHKLDIFIWESVAKKLKEWNEHGFKDMSISVNISAKDLYYVDVLQTFIDIVKKYEIEPKQLNIEITEAGFMENFEFSKKLLEDLQENNFKVEIDDFGCGYSSLNMLKDINADVLKIGHTFLCETENQERSDKILHAIISMAKDLGMEVLAVGVENTEQVKLLNKLGCEHFQGSLFSAPIQIEEFERGYL